MRLNWRSVVGVKQGWRQWKSAKISGMGFCSSCLLVVGAIQQLYYKSPVMSQLFGEGIDVKKVIQEKEQDLFQCELLNGL